MSHADFQARLERMGAAQHVRPPEPERTPGTKVKRKEARPEWVENVAYTGSFVGAFFLGLLSILIARYVQFHMMGVPDPNGDADMQMMVDAGVAFMVVWFFRMLFDMKSHQHIVCKTAGLWVALCTMHNLVHLYPNVWATVFSQEWVNMTRAMSEPNSILFRGMSFTLS